MTPVRTTAKSSKSKAKARKPPARGRPKAAGKAKRTVGAKTGIAPNKAKASGAGKGPAGKAAERRHCAATDPFGDPCQSAPRLPSAYCTIHSYLDR